MTAHQLMVLIATLAPGAAQAAEVVWSERVELASGEAHQGPWRMNRSDFRWVDDPTVTMDDAGGVAVAWVDQSGKDILFQRYSPGGKARFERPVNVSRTPRVFSWLPKMVAPPGDTDRVYVLWQEIVFSGGSHGGEIFFARSTDGGRTFHAPLNLSNSIAGDGKGRLTRRHWHNGSLDLALGPKGTLHAVWTEYEGTLWASRSSDGGKTFSKPVRIAGGRAPARGPSLAVAADQTIHVAWTVGEDPSADIHVATSKDAGRSFGRPRRVVQSAGHADAPKIAIDGKGTVHLVYAESSTGPFEEYHVVYTRSADGAKTFAKPQVISHASPKKLGGAAFPSLSLDGKGHLYVLWEVFPERSARPRGLAFTMSTDAGRTFAPPTVVPGTADPSLGHNGGRQGLLMKKLAVNGKGAIAVVNSTFKSGEKSRIWLIRGSLRRGSSRP